MAGANARAAVASLMRVALRAGVFAAITVSGLASADDHGLIVAVLEAYLAQ